MRSWSASLRALSRALLACLEGGLGAHEGVEAEDLGEGVVEFGPVRPFARQGAGAGLPLQGELGGEGGLWVVEVPPAVPPDLAALGPAVGVAGQEELEALGEAGLAGAVAADDEGEAGAGGEVEGGLGADAAEAWAVMRRREAVRGGFLGAAGAWVGASPSGPSGLRRCRRRGAGPAPPDSPGPPGPGRTIRPRGPCPSPGERGQGLGG